MVAAKDWPPRLRQRDLAYAIGVKAQGPLGGNGRVQLAHRAGRGIARVDKGFLSGRPLALVERLKISAAHVDLSAHLQQRRRRQRPGRAGIQAQGNLPDGADVLGHVLTRFAVSAGGRLHQAALLVTQTHGQAVKLGLCHIVDRRGIISQPEFPPHPGVEVVRARGLGVGFGANAEHGHCMAYAGKGSQRRRTDPLGR